MISALQAADEHDLPVLREVVAGRQDDDQLEFKIDVILVGLEHVLLRKRPSL
ncbi:hypothetical protein [Nocardia sp. NPDC049526]|uniref:hypothetical protein n=1 Tax=Nocardia sp. NPDC049526 TaxID=3364316 RepID=UPI0037894280